MLLTTSSKGLDHGTTQRSFDYTAQRSFDDTAKVTKFKIYKKIFLVPGLSMAIYSPAWVRTKLE